MREINECTAEVFRRSENRIKERKKNRNRILAMCIPLCLIITIFSVAMIPGILPVGMDSAPEAGNQSGDFGDPGDNNEDGNGDMDGAVNAAVAKLPEDMRVVIHLIYFEEMTYDEAAKVMKKNRKQVDNLLYRAKKELRIILGKDGELLL